MNGLDAWLAAGATAGLWLCLAWLLVGFTVAVLAEAPGSVGALCGRIAARVSPPLVRRVAQCTTGLVLAAASVVGAGGAAGAVAGVDAATQPPAPAPPGPTALPSPTRELPTVWLPTGSAASPTVRLPTGSAESPAVTPRLPLSPQPAATGGTDPKRLHPTGDPVPPEGGATPAVVVVRGDTLWDIAAQELGAEPRNREIAARWPAWYAANRSVIGPDPDLILPGQRLSPPE
jgi:nucleoid-associated protein YgaU